MSEYRVLGITLARVGSKSVPKKNIQIIAGKPLLCYTIEEALKSSYLNRYIVSTDDPEIQNVAIEAGAEAPFLRPAEFSNDNATSVSALQHAVSWAEQDKGKEYDFIVELMCTNPLKTVEDIDACIHKLVATGADSVIAVHKVEDHHPIRIKKIVDDKIADFCLPEIPEIRRQDLKPEAYIRSGSIYALTRDHLMKDCKRYGSKNSRPYILSSNRAVNIDSKIDLFKAEAILKDLD